MGTAVGILALISAGAVINKRKTLLSMTTLESKCGTYSLDDSIDVV